MNSKKRLIIGGLLASVGGLALILVPAYDLIPDKSPWDFLVGFSVGLAAGLGGALALYGLLELKTKNEM